MKSTNRANLPAAILVLLLLMVWQAAAIGMDAAYILPSPAQVLRRLWELRKPLFCAHLPATMSVVGIGLLISIVLGLALAILMDLSPVAEKALYPLVIASQTIPTTALAPLFVLWFGYSIWSKVLVTVLMTFFLLYFDYSIEAVPWYSRSKSYWHLIFAALIEPFVYHPFVSYCANVGYFQYIKGTTAVWKPIARKGVQKKKT